MECKVDPIICHRMVWYNFLYHVDRKIELSARLTAWATDVSQPYLLQHAQQFLAINTMEHTWNDHFLGDHDVLDIDSNLWTTIGTKKKTTRSLSPLAASGKHLTAITRTRSAIADEDTPNTTSATTATPSRSRSR
jgi:hypothetical protein